MQLLVLVFVLMQLQKGASGVKVLDAPIPQPEPTHKASHARRNPPAASSSSSSSPSSSSSSSSFNNNIMPGMARLESMDVKCGRSGMNVELVFTAPFPGVVYSKGHFSDPACMYVTGDGAPSKTYRFTVPADGCGTKGQVQPASPDRDTYMENTIVVQADPLIQEVWDEAREIKCIWQHTLQKSVNFAPIKVYEPETIGVQLDSRAVNTLMEIQKGVGGPLRSPPTGYVHVGDDISVVMYVQDPKMDANVLACNATSATGGSALPLVDERGCLLRPDLLTPFAKTRKTNGVKADLMLYSYLKAFNLGETPEFVISCELEVCEDACSTPCAGGPQRRSRRRKRRSVGEEEEEEEEEEEALVVEENLPSSSSSPKSRKVRLERGVVIMSRRDLEEREACLFHSTTALLSLALLVALVLALALLSLMLGYKLWALKQVRSKQLF